MSISSYFDKLLGGETDIIQRSLSGWRAGIDHEVEFWTRWFQTRGLEWPSDYLLRTSPSPLAPWIEPYVNIRDHVKILDVGAGPLTKIGHTSPKYNLSITAIDPLADYYNLIVDNFSVVPIVRTQLGFAEDLTARFESNFFDVTVSINALVN